MSHTVHAQLNLDVAVNSNVCGFAAITLFGVLDTGPDMLAMRDTYLCFLGNQLSLNVEVCEC